MAFEVFFIQTGFSWQIEPMQEGVSFENHMPLWYQVRTLEKEQKIKIKKIKPNQMSSKMLNAKY